MKAKVKVKVKVIDSSPYLTLLLAYQVMLTLQHETKGHREVTDSYNRSTTTVPNNTDTSSISAASGATYSQTSDVTKSGVDLNIPSPQGESRAINRNSTPASGSDYVNKTTTTSTDKPLTGEGNSNLSDNLQSYPKYTNLNPPPLDDDSDPKSTSLVQLQEYTPIKSRRNPSPLDRQAKRRRRRKRRHKNRNISSGAADSGHIEAVASGDKMAATVDDLLGAWGQADDATSGNQTDRFAARRQGQPHRPDVMAEQGVGEIGRSGADAGGGEAETTDARPPPAIGLFATVRELVLTVKDLYASQVSDR